VISRDEFILELKKKGIGTSVHFIPISLHPFFAQHAHRPENQCPRALELYRRLISLPLYPGMTEADVEQVAGAVREIARRAHKKAFFASAVSAVRHPNVAF
jgi:dTDP-4-amino-4,6-dideoxygalactose transaminase